MVSLLLIWQIFLSNETYNWAKQIRVTIVLINPLLTKSSEGLFCTSHIFNKYSFMFSLFTTLLNLYCTSIDWCPIQEFTATAAVTANKAFTENEWVKEDSMSHLVRKRLTTDWGGGMFHSKHTQKWKELKSSINVCNLILTCPILH